MFKDKCTTMSNKGLIQLKIGENMKEQYNLEPHNVESGCHLLWLFFVVMAFCGNVLYKKCDNKHINEKFKKTRETIKLEQLLKERNKAISEQEKIIEDIYISSKLLRENAEVELDFLESYMKKQAARPKNFIASPYHDAITISPENFYLLLERHRRQKENYLYDITVPETVKEQIHSINELTNDLQLFFNSHLETLNARLISLQQRNQKIPRIKI